VAEKFDYIPALTRHYQRNCRRRGISFRLRRAQFEALVTAPCHYCGRPPYALWSRSSTGLMHGHFYYTGIDRLDNGRGYEEGNVVPCCKECNGLKSDRLTESETRAVAQALLRHRRGE
jgi:hypothetical protein